MKLEDTRMPDHSSSTDSPPGVEQVYTREAAARILKLCGSTVGKLVKSGRLRAVQAGFGGVRMHVRIPASAIAEFLAQGK
jgi:excisionase family DNA binding protein